MYKFKDVRYSAIANYSRTSLNFYDEAIKPNFEKYSVYIKFEKENDKCINFLSAHPKFVKVKLVEQKDTPTYSWKHTDI